MGDLGIVRRQSREISETPQCLAETSKFGEPQVSDGSTQDKPIPPQDCSQETVKTANTRGPQGQDGSCQDRPRSSSGSSQEALVPQDVPYPCLSSSLVADYSDSESE